MKTLIFLLDAVRYDQINNKLFPFLSSLQHSNTFLKLRTLLGYSVGIHPSIWTGLYQENHGRFTIFYYDPKNSSFKNAKWLYLIPSETIRKYFIGALKVPYYKFKILKQRTPPWYDKIIKYPPALPPSVAPYFSLNPIAPKYQENLFSLLEKERISWFGQADLTALWLTKKLVNVENMRLTNADVDIFYMYFGDGFGHTFGPFSRTTINYFRHCDAKIKEIISKAKKKYGKVHYFIFSDHGMCEVKHYLDLRTYFKKLGYKQPKDFVAFFDATMIRFWYHKEKVREKVLDSFSQIKHLTYLDDKFRKKYRIRFKDRKWGDDLFLVDPNFRIFPDYFAPIKGALRGLHGYSPDASCSYGFFLTNALSTKKDEIKVVDIFPTILKSLKIKVPNGIDGKCLR